MPACAVTDDSPCASCQGSVGSDCVVYLLEFDVCNVLISGILSTPQRNRIADGINCHTDEFECCASLQLMLSS